jgi:hypothetical protein
MKAKLLFAYERKGEVDFCDICGCYFFLQRTIPTVAAEIITATITAIIRACGIMKRKRMVRVNHVFIIRSLHFQKSV